MATPGAATENAGGKLAEAAIVDGIFRALSDPTRRQVLERLSARPASVSELAARMNIEMPICDAVHAIVHEGRDIDTAMAMLMARPLTFE